MTNKQNFAGFTLIELLVTIVIIGILATIYISTFSGYFEKARLAKAQSSASQIKSLFLAQNASTENELFTAWYTFDGDSDVSNLNPYILDKSGTGNDLVTTYAGVNTFSQDNEAPLKTGKSLKIDAGELLSRAVSRPINKFTIAFWFKLEESNDYPYIILYGNSSTIATQTNNRISFSVASVGSIISPANVFLRERWYYVVTSYNGSSLKLYLDGDLIAHQEGLSSNSISDKRLVLGYSNHPGRDFYGWLDEVMFFPYAFNGKELE